MEIFRRKNFANYEFCVDENDYQFVLDDYNILLLQNMDENVIDTDKGTIIIKQERKLEQKKDGEYDSNFDIVIIYNNKEVFRKNSHTYCQEVYDQFGNENQSRCVLANEDLAFEYDFTDFAVKINFTSIMFNMEDDNFDDVYADYHILIKVK